MDILKYIENEILLTERMISVYSKHAQMHPGKTITRAAKRGRVEYYYRVNGVKKKHYIESHDLDFLEEMYRKYFATKALEILRKNLNLLYSLRDGYSVVTSESVLSELTETCRDLKNKLVNEKRLKDSVKNGSVYRPSQNPYKREELIYLTQSGVMVRSKSEIFIADALFSLGLEFGYEQALEIMEYIVDDSGNVNIYHRTIYPDFTIYLKDGTIVYWEHFGLWDDPEYRKKALDKISTYYDNNIYCGHNLITTFEGKEKPFDPSVAKETVRRQLL